MLCFAVSVLRYTDSDYPFGILKLDPFPHSLNVKWLIRWMCCDFINSFEDCVPDEKNTNKMFKKTNEIIPS
jgi:hypothetical protein